MTKPPTAEAQPSASSPPRRIRTVLIIFVIGAILAGLVWHLKAGHKAVVKAKADPLPVAVQAATKGDINVYLEGLGAVTPLATITVKTQISGQLTEVAFAEGQMVKKGDILAVIDPRPYQVALEQSQGQLRQAQAQLSEARIDLTRYEKLAQQDSIAQQQVDAQRALVDQDEGVVETDQAAVDNAKLNLVYCHVTAPVDGRVGLRMVDEGNYVMPSDAGLVVLTRVKPITVLFTLPEQNIPEVAARLHAGASIPVDAFDQNETRQLASGKLLAIDNEVDPTTGTFRLRALFANDDETLFPNQFVNVRMLLATERQVTVIPASGVERNQQGSFVYVLQPGNKVAVRSVTLGAADGEQVRVLSGVALGDRIVVDGADRLKDGQLVTVQKAK